MRKEEGDLRKLLCKPKSIKILITERSEKRSKVMRLKKFLSAALSAAMLISCVSFGGGTVVQAAGEMNIARNLQISAYSGTEGDFPVSSVFIKSSSLNSRRVLKSSSTALSGLPRLDGGDSAVTTVCPLNLPPEKRSTKPCFRS